MLPCGENGGIGEDSGRSHFCPHQEAHDSGEEDGLLWWGVELGANEGGPSDVVHLAGSTGADPGHQVSQAARQWTLCISDKRRCHWPQSSSAINLFDRTTATSTTTPSNNLLRHHQMMSNQSPIGSSVPEVTLGLHDSQDSRNHWMPKMNSLLFACIWTNKCSIYFAMYQIPACFHVLTASFHMTGVVAHWF
jgi:hypothetical protein